MANHIVARTALLFVVAALRCVMFAVEQPNSTRLYSLPYMSYVRRLCAMLKIDFYEKFLSGPYYLQCTWYRRGMLCAHS